MHPIHVHLQKFIKINICSGIQVTKPYYTCQENYLNFARSMNLTFVLKIKMMSLLNSSLKNWSYLPLSRIVVESTTTNALLTMQYLIF